MRKKGVYLNPKSSRHITRAIKRMDKKFKDLLENVADK